jgi:hypothetical protein
MIGGIHVSIGDIGEGAGWWKERDSDVTELFGGSDKALIDM